MIVISIDWYITYEDGTVRRCAPTDGRPTYLRSNMDISWKERMYNPPPIVEAVASDSIIAETQQKMDSVGGFGTYRNVPIKFDESMALGSPPVYKDGVISVPTDFPDQIDVWLPLLSDFDEGTDDIKFISMDDFEDKMVQRMLHSNDNDEDEAPAF